MSNQRFSFTEKNPSHLSIKMLYLASAKYEGEWHSTSGMKPHPYMRPALNENREKILNIIKEGMLNG